MEDKTISIQSMFILIYIFIKRYLKLFTLAFVISMIFAILMYVTADKLYETKLTIVVHAKGMFIDILENLNKQIAGDNKSDVMRIFGVESKTAENIVSIKPIRSYVINLTDQKKNEIPNFVVAIRVKNDSLLMNDSFYWLKYLTEHNKHLNEVFEIEKRNLKTLLNFYEKKILELDSLEKREIIVRQGQIVLENDMSYQQKKIDLYKAKLEVETALFFHRPIIEIEKFDSKITFPKKINFLINIILINLPFLLFAIGRDTFLQIENKINSVAE